MFILALGIGFFLGKNFQSYLEVVNKTNITVASDKPIISCPPVDCPPCDVDEKKQEGAVFDESAIVADPKSTVDFFNKLCTAVTKSSSTPQGRKLGVVTIIFCYKHILTYKRNYSYEWDNVDSAAMGYYTGKDLPP